MTTLKRGKYFIGDPCYVLGHVWDDVCDIIIDGQSCLEGAFTLESGHRFVLYGTAHGDGSYPDGDGNEYGVDAGCIGAVPIEAIDPKIIAEYGEPTVGPYRDALGQIVDFEAPFECKSEVVNGWNSGQGMLTFGHVKIDTDPVFDENEDRIRM